MDSFNIPDSSSPFSSMLFDNPIFAFFFLGILTIIVVTFLAMIIKGLSTWTSNNAAEIITASCTVVSKRTKVSGGSGDSSASTRYYITFEFERGERKEIPVSGRYYGMIAEGDIGQLTYQGTRFKEFKRNNR